MRAQTMAHVGNNSVIRILSSVDLSRYVSRKRARCHESATAFINGGRASATRQRPHKYKYKRCMTIWEQTTLNN